jgi:hypothetical protein
LESEIGFVRNGTCKGTGVEMTQKQSFQMIAEMKEFATFTAAEQRYIRRSLDVAERGGEAAERWSRNATEQSSIQAQARLYRTVLPLISASIPDDIAVDAAAELIGPLIALSALDLSEGRLASFAAYRFLYERLLGGTVRPWLPSAFVAAAALPSLHPTLRQALLGSITASDAAAHGWSNRDAIFIPEWVDEVEVTVSQN